MTPDPGEDEPPSRSRAPLRGSSAPLALELIAQALADREAPHAARAAFALGAAALLADVPGAAHVAALLEHAAGAPPAGLGAALAGAHKLLERLPAAREELA